MIDKKIINKLLISIDKANDKKIFKEAELDELIIIIKTINDISDSKKLENDSSLIIKYLNLANKRNAFTLDEWLDIKEDIKSIRQNYLYDGCNLDTINEDD